MTTLTPPPVARRIVTALVAALALLLMAAAPPARAADAPVGQWENSDGTFVVAYLPDGRVASWSKKSYLPPSAVRMETGTYTVAGDTLRSNWLLTGPEVLAFQVDGDTISVTPPKAPFPLRYHRTGGAEEAARTYAQVAAKLREIAADAAPKVAVGAVRPGRIPVRGVVADHHPDQVFPGATVYTGSARFQWVQTPVRTYSHKLDEPGVTCFSYTFLPNGRYYFDGWLYGIDMNDGVPYDERDPAQVRAHTVPVRHTQFWGRYRVVPGRDPLTGDTVELVGDDGKRGTFKVPFGRLYMVTDSPRMLLDNYNQQRL